MKKILHLSSLLIIASLLLAAAAPVHAQDPKPPEAEQSVEYEGGSRAPGNQAHRFSSPAISGGEIERMSAAQGLRQDAGGMWYQEGNSAVTSALAEPDISAQASADAFGYTIQPVAFNWVDVSGGTWIPYFKGANVDFPEGFDFPFYDRVYHSAWVSPYGYLQFGDPTPARNQSPMNEPSEPNSVIAPYWVPLYYDDTNGFVRTQPGTDEHGDYVAVEWYRFGTRNFQSSFTFEALLYENGDIVFQYQEMEYSWEGWICATAGIEDWTGTVSRTGLSYCAKQRSNTAYRYVYPRPAARVRIFPLTYGTFGGRGLLADMRFNLTNSGTLGEDVFDFSIKSAWPVTLVDGSTMRLLEDSDGDGKVDTGSICSFCSMSILAYVHVPYNAVPNQTQNSMVTAASSLKPSAKVTITLQTTIPAAFAQSYSLSGKNQLEYVSPTSGSLAVENSGASTGSAPALATFPNGNIISVWSDYFCDAATCPYEELYYNIYDRQGRLARAASKVQDFSGLEEIWDYSATAAAAPDGTAGIVWVHEERLGSPSYDLLYNIYFATLDQTGEIQYGPVSITRNEIHWDRMEPYGMRYFEPRITATADNRFVLSWREENWETTTKKKDNIFTTILNTSGSVAHYSMAHTLDDGSLLYQEYDLKAYYAPAVTALSGNRFLLAWSGVEIRRKRYDNLIFYQIIDSKGSPVTPVWEISTGGYSNYGAEAAQMSNGQVVLAWSRDSSPAWNAKPYITYTVLDNLTYRRVAALRNLSHPAGLTGGDYLSITSDTAGHANLTWGDGETSFGKHLYYALLGKNGSIIIKPAVAATSHSRGEGGLYLNAAGYSSAPLIP